MVCQIILTRGLVTLVDEEDFAQLVAHKWMAKPVQSRKGGFYAYRSAKIDGRKRSIYMHRVILEAPCGALVDHRDGNGLNNQRANLRLATHSQNLINRETTGASGYRGVETVKRGKRTRFVPYIHLDRRHRKRLGYFANAEDAARAYDEAAIAAYGEWARLNFPRAA